MKITRVETVLLSAIPAQQVRWSGGVMPCAHASLVQVHTDAGISGLGETYIGLFHPKAVPGIVESLAPFLIGEDPTRIAAIFHSVYSKVLFWGRVGAGISTIGAIETALWDITAKSLGVPVYKLLGGGVHDRLKLYASGGLDRPLAETERELEEYRQMGLRAVKIRVGQGIEKDVQKVALARSVLGPDCDLMLDAVQGHDARPWTAAQALETARALEPYNIRWLEEPCSAEDYEGYAFVRRNTRIPISGGESTTSLHEFRMFFEHEALDIAQPDVSHSGGILATRRICEEAAKHHVEVALHSWGSSVILAGNYHLAFTTPNARVVEYPTWGNPLRDALFSEPLRMEDGYVYPPQAPGLGVELTEEARRQYAFRPELGLVMQRD